MQRRGLQGLRGLKGLNTLSPEERNAFMEANASKLDIYRNPMKRRQAANILSMNQKYINTFGIDKFNLNNDGTEDAFHIRNEETKFKLVTDAFKNTFGKDDNFNELATYLDIDGMYDLLNNPDYLTTGELGKKYSTNLDAAKRVGKTYNKVIQNPYVDALGQGFMQIGKQASAQTPLDILNKDKERNKEILDRLKAESQKRREDAIQGDADIIYANMLAADDSGKQSMAKTLKEFNKIAMSSNNYKQFKNSRWLNDYDDEAKLKDYAKYLALQSKYGKGVADHYLETSMQNRIADAQDGSFTGNTLKGILTTAWSDIGSNVALFANAKNLLNVDRMAILNQGKDPDKPIYNKKGQIVDYKENTNIWTNPAYWNNVYKYNTFSPTNIKAIEEAGGISPDVNVRHYGSTPDFLSWETVQEGFKQGGHVLAGIAETALTGGIGKAIGWGGKAALKGLGLSAKAIQTASKVGAVTNDILVGATTGLEGSQLEAMGTFDDQMQSAKEKINAEIERELTDYQQSINYNSREAKAGINAFYNQLKAKDNRRVALGNREGARAFPLSDATLRAQAKQLYTNQLLEGKQKELQELHKKDEMEAARTATKAYMTNFLMDYVKNIPLTTAIQKFKIAKGSMRGAFDNTINESIVADAESGGVRRAFNKIWDKKAKKYVDNPKSVKRFSSGKQLTKSIVGQFAGGFMDEYLDGINASFAGGVGNNIFDNYIRKNYDPKAYDSTMDSMLGNLVGGMSEGIDGLVDRENLYEGFIGGISPVATVMPNANAAWNFKPTWNAVLKGTDEYGNKINYAERASRLLMNPLLNAVVEAKEKDRRVDRAVEAINNVISANKDKLNTAAKIVSVLGDYNTPIDGNNPRNILDSKDGKLYNAFTLIHALNSLENIGGEKSQLYKDAMNTIQGLADGSLSQDAMDAEIDRFLADPDNKSILDQGEEGKAIAAQRLQSNAKYFMDLKDKMDNIEQLYANSPSLKSVTPAAKAFLMYNTVASEDYKKRLESIEDELGLSHTDAESTYTPDYNLRYGTDAAKKRAITGIEKEMAKVDKEIEKLKSSNDYNEKKARVYKRQVDNTSDAKETANLKSKIQGSKVLIDSQKFYIKSLEETKRKLQNQKNDIENTELTGIEKTSNGVTKLFLTKDDLLNYDVRDIAYVLDSENNTNFTEGRKEIIDSIKASLKKQDPEALRKIKDAAILADRIEDLNTVYNKVMDNNDLAANFFEAAEESRNRAAFGEAIEREIKYHYGRIESAYLDREEEPKLLRKEALKVHSETLDAYMKDHPQQVDAIKPYYDMLKYGEDLSVIINGEGYTDEFKETLNKGIKSLQQSSDNVDEWKNLMEGLIDDNSISPSIREALEKILNKMTKLGYQRDSTILEERKQRKEREEADRKKKEEGAKKAEDDAKKAAEKKVEEESKKKEKPKESVAEPVGEADIEGADLEHLDLGMSNEELNAIPVDDGMEKEDYTSINTKDTKEHNEKDVDIEGGNKETKPQTVEDEDLQQTPDGVIDGKLLMSDNYGNGSIGFGDMYYGKVGSAKKGNFMATRDGDKITFSIDGNKETLYIAPEDYEVVTDEQEKHKKELIIANSLEKIDGDWYFNGTFADDNKQTQVKASDKFDIDKAIEEQQSARKVAIADEVSTAPNVIDNGDSVQVVSENIEQQASDVASDDKEVAVSDVNEDMDDANAIGENAIENNITTLSGNAMSRYDMEPLVGDGRIVLKKGKDERRQMDDFYAWMKAEGINLQNIIDHELARIIRRNPHAKVRFLMTNPNLKVTNDDKVHTHLFLALDYDNSINKGITSIHNDENGGVLESDGKKYLVIGVAGYGGLQNKAQQSLYNRLFNTYKSSGPTGMLIHPRRDFFAGHPNDRFYVAKDYTTEIVPHSQIPGYIVRQSLKDDNVQYRSVKELLSDKERNPMGYEFNDLAWGIQELSQFLIIGASLDKVMVPRNIIGNLGSAFVLMPASNGKMVPSYLKVLKYTEMKDGVLKDRVNDLLNKVVAPDYNTRYAAALELSNIFYMEKEGDFILLRKNKGEISLTHNGEVQKTFVLDSNFDRIEFMKAFEDINPRVNITARVLTSKKLLSEYDEAGALQTDAAMFGTAGSSYSIYALDNEGKMIIPAKAESQAPKADDGEWRNTNRRQIIFKKQYYTYNPEESDAFYLNSKAVTDAREIQQLQYIRRVLDGDFLPATSKGVWDYYVLDSTDSSEVIKIDRNSKEVRELPEKEAKELIKKLEEEKARKAKEEKAKEIMNKATDEGKGIEDVSLEGESTYVNPETGEVVQRETEAPQADNEENTSSDKASEESTNKPPIASEGQVATKQSSDTQSLADLMGNSKYRVRLRKIIANKWKDAPKHPEELEKYLRGKNIDVDNIGTSKEDIESWIKTIEDCR